MSAPGSKFARNAFTVRAHCARLMTGVALRQLGAAGREELRAQLRISEEAMRASRRGEHALCAYGISLLTRLDRDAAEWLDRDRLDACCVGTDKLRDLRAKLVGRLDIPRLTEVLGPYSPMVGEFTVGLEAHRAREVLPLELLTCRQHLADGAALLTHYQSCWVVRRLVDHLARTNEAFAAFATPIMEFVIQSFFPPRSRFLEESIGENWGARGAPPADEVNSLYMPAWRGPSPQTCFYLLNASFMPAGEAPRPLDDRVLEGCRERWQEDERLTQRGPIDGRRSVTPWGTPSIRCILSRAVEFEVQRRVGAHGCLALPRFYKELYGDRHLRRRRQFTHRRCWSVASVERIEEEIPEAARWLRPELVQAAEGRRSTLLQNAERILQRAGVTKYYPDLLSIASTYHHIEDPIDNLAYALLRMEVSRLMHYIVGFISADSHLVDAILRLRNEPAFPEIEADLRAYVQARFAPEQTRARKIFPTINRLDQPLLSALVEPMLPAKRTPLAPLMSAPRPAPMPRTRVPPANIRTGVQHGA